VTIDEELSLLDQQLRRLKIEYEIFFNNPAKRPPTDVEWKVLSLIRKFSDGTRISVTSPAYLRPRPALPLGPARRPARGDLGYPEAARALPSPQVLGTGDIEAHPGAPYLPEASQLVRHS